MEHEIKVKIEDLDIEVLLNETKQNIPPSIAKKIIEKWEILRQKKILKESEGERRKRLSEAAKNIYDLIDKE